MDGLNGLLPSLSVPGSGWFMVYGLWFSLRQQEGAIISDVKIAFLSDKCFY
jgi:hypothetical protein